MTSLWGTRGWCGGKKEKRQESELEQALGKGVGSGLRGRAVSKSPVSELINIHDAGYSERREVASGLL